MKILLTTLNAKFIHSSLALRSLKAYSARYSDNISVMEFTINQTESFILAEIFKAKPDIIGFSCYIWNISQIVNLLSSIKKILPDTKIILGGPEVSYEYEPLLMDNSADVIVIGEGEAAFYELLKHYVSGEVELGDICGIAYKSDTSGQVIVNPACNTLKLDDIHFTYSTGFSDLNNKIIYYESSRGCPYSCGYCLSGAKGTVRYLSLERVFSDLRRFLDAGVRQVKFVDRTFNANKNRTSAIWEFLIKNDNGITNFHFEVCADLICPDEINLLKKARKGLFQFEIGVQSTNEQTLAEIGRQTDLNKIYKNVKAIKEMGTIHQHLDLIAGLPYEDYLSFKKSFNEVFALEPEMLQLGFLKVLKGSKMREFAVQYETAYKNSADYEVFSTSWLTYAELLRLKGTGNVLEIFYNSGQFSCSVKYLISFFESPFEFFEEISLYWEKEGYHSISHSKISLYSKLYGFSALFLRDGDIEIIKEFLLFDLLRTEKLKSLPDGLPFSKEIEHKEFAKQFYNDSMNVEKYFGANALCVPIKQIIRKSNIVWSEYDVLAFLDKGILKKSGHHVLFNYIGEEILVFNL